eukprot:CAMPEP_0197280816 /NCGR_PEP_ID=MMETSP1432-20130617/21868_1 /TAXON_ID=44447 /ORGANISM="Pseudo-nitzschia delicatissima, Strain UNC1205" /LENGTH=328 /DNA_ID=CAMNT_0042747539 /DNA_START=87 /DNA_END=1071 /DNA_ORIENTATION=-
MEVDSATTGETRIALHPLAIVHMSDQFTRITSGGSPLDKNAPVVGLLFGLSDNDSSEEGAAQVQVLDADDIPVEISDASNTQVNLHTTVFPKHKVVGWYRVVSQTENEDIEPSQEDLEITKILQNHYANAEFFCFCLLKVQSKQKDDDSMKTEETTLHKELPIHLYQLSNYDSQAILLGLSNWQLETSPSERLSVERVMKEKPVGNGDTPYVLETKAVQHSLVSMKDRVDVLTNYLRDVQSGSRPADYKVMRQIQQIVACLGPLSNLASTTNEGEDEDVELLAHLAIVARTVNTLQSYTEKFRMMNEAGTAPLNNDTRSPIFEQEQKY